VLNMSASSSRVSDGWNDWHRGSHSLPPRAHRAKVRMDRIGQKGVLVVLPDLDKLSASEGASYDIGGAARVRGHPLRYTTTLLGHTRALEVCDVDGAMHGNAKLASEQDAAAAAILLHTTIRIGAPPSQTNVSNASGLSVSLVDEARHELLYACAQGLSVSLSATAESLLISGKISRLQVDNQSSNGPRIALVSPWPPDDRSSFLDADLELSRSVTSISYWRHVLVSTGSLRLQLHETVLWGLLQFEHACCSPAAAAVVDADHTTAVDGGERGACEKGAAALLRGARHVEGSCDPATGLAPEEAMMLSELAFLDEVFFLDSGMHFEEISLPEVCMEVTLQGLQAVKWRPQHVGHDDRTIRVFADAYSQMRVLAASSLGLPDVEAHRMTLPELSYTDWSTTAGSTLSALIWGHYRKTVMMQGLKVGT
jgi:hypothetical protein